MSYKYGSSQSGSALLQALSLIVIVGLVVLKTLPDLTSSIDARFRKQTACINELAYSVQPTANSGSIDDAAHLAVSPQVCMSGGTIGSSRIPGIATGFNDFDDSLSNGAGGNPNLGTSGGV